MADSYSEQVLKAFFAALQVAAPIGVTVARNETFPARVPAGGWICLRDGDPGTPEALMSPPVYVYEHLAEVDIVTALDAASTRDTVFDALKQVVGAAIVADRTLGGLCDYVLGDAPVPVEVPVEGAETFKAATIGVNLIYGTSDPLA
ncbi:MAG: acyl-CoA transferase [Heliomarina sp.]|uniref:acyl-CoA transferase n=1 Tax=Heliomarina sp. TaxID=2917556 RepID=UPI00405A43B7